MTFNAAVPLNSDSPSTFPAQNQTNMARLQTLLGADHQFNLSAAADDGYHNVIHMTQQAPSGLLAATGRAYAKSANGTIQSYYMDNTGTEFQITPTIPTYAAVNFTGRSTNGAATRNYQQNVSSVDRTGTSLYTINFIVSLPTNFYIVISNAWVPDGFNPFVAIQTSATYGGAVQTGLLKIIAPDNGVTMITVCGG